MVSVRFANLSNTFRTSPPSNCHQNWRQEITVTGLLTGQDLLEGLLGKDLGDAILLPSLMLKQGDTRFLDDMTVEELTRHLGISILPINGIEELIERLKDEDFL